MSPQPPCSQPGPDPTAPEPDVEELRLAIALNGGVSLAVWMGGCAVELDRARRASPAADPTSGNLYEALCHCFGRRLTIDILTGSSAGGINGGLLAAAIASNQTLEVDYIRERWLNLGDLSKILFTPSVESPSSLMDGEMFRRELRTTFAEVLDTDVALREPGRARKGLRRVLPKLDITMTDVVGVERRFRDSWGAPFVAREHRPRFKFRKLGDYTADALADAARTSASFPLAFEPWPVKGSARTLAGLPRWTYGIDGGLLDNAPIRSALDLIPAQGAASRVRRYLCYINGDPDPPSETDAEGAPNLLKVGGYMINLPRKAPLVDHLYAIRDAVERPRRSRRIQEELLGMDLPQLEATAEALFDVYRERRTLESLEELLSEPADVNSFKQIFEKSESQLPWIPRQRQLGTTWDWGLRPAQRIIHLLLDLLRLRLKGAKAEVQCKRLLAARVKIDVELERLGEAYEDVTGDENAQNPSSFEIQRPGETVEGAIDRAQRRAPMASEAVLRVMMIFRDEVDHDPRLFGPSGSTETAAREYFFSRVLSIEVVRRALAAESDIESAEPLSFVQLTPEAPSPIFTRRPQGSASPGSAAKKLAGVGLGHFAGFYRRSWRANDYMWGRLDAAARIVDLLLDKPSTDVGVTATERPERLTTRSELLATALVPAEKPQGEEEGDPEKTRRWLLEEALAEVAEEEPREGSKKDEGSSAETAPLKERLSAQIRADLEAGEDKKGRLGFTRAVFQRAVQLEILETELKEVQEESRKDRELGSAAKELKLRERGKPSGSQADIEAVRAIYGRGSSLPAELNDPSEAVSTLGLQTITRASFVSLNAIRTAGVPMSKFLGFARPPLLAVAGMVASSRFYRVVTALGFWVAAMYLTSRLVTEDETKTLTFDTVWSPQTLLAAVALSCTLAFVAVPGLRVRQKAAPLLNLVYATLILIAAGALADVLALSVGGLSVERILFTPSAELPPEWLMWTVLGVLGVVSLSRLPLPSWMQAVVKPLGKLREQGWVIATALLIVFVPLAYYTGRAMVEAWPGALWQKIAIGVSFLVAPLAASLVTRVFSRR